MKIKEQAIKELESLEPSELITLYEIIISLKTKLQRPKIKKELGYLRVKKALAECKGALSDDILLLRGDRI